MWPFNRKEKRSSKLVTEWLKGNDLSMYGPKVAGVVVNENTAYNLPVVLSCIRVISEDVGSLPLIVYKRFKGGGKERAYDHPLYALLHDAPNEEMTAMSFRECLHGHLETWGNAYAEIDWDNSGQVRALWPLRPDKMQVKRHQDKQIYYHYSLPNGKTAVLPLYRVLHIPNFGFDGIQGYSTISLGKEAIALGMAQQGYFVKYFENNAAPDVILMYPEDLDEQARENITESWEDRHKGLSKSHRVAILEEGLKIQEVGFSPEASQLIEARKFQLEEVARMFRIPLTKIDHPDKATYSNTEQEDLSYSKDTIRPRCVRWEQTITHRLMRPKERREYFAEFLIEGILRGDLEARGEFYKVMRYAGAMSADEIRDKENMNPVPDGKGKGFWMPINMMDTSQPPPEIPQRSEVRSRDKIVLPRLRIMKAWRQVFFDAAQRVVKRESIDMRKAANKIFKDGNFVDFQNFYEEYYRDFPGIVERFMSPVFMGYGEEIQASAAEEVNGDVGFDAGYEDCMQQHIERFAEYHANQSCALLRGAGTRDINDITLENISSEIDSWETRRADDIAQWETVRSNGLISKATYFFAGCKGYEWVQEAQAINLCSMLDGLQVGMRDCGDEMSFWELRPEKYRSLEGFVPSWGVQTPPLFLGCECQIRAII